jgi:hypothetical protein
MRYSPESDTRAVSQGLIVFFAGVLTSVGMFLLLQRPWAMVQDMGRGRVDTVAASRSDAYIASLDWTDALFSNYLGIAVIALLLFIIVYSVYSSEVPGV